MWLNERRNSFGRLHHAKGVYIINSVRNCISSKRYALYIIKPQENARWRVMRYSPKGWWYAPHFVRRWYAKPAAWIKKFRKHSLSEFFGGATQIWTGDRGVADLCLTTWLWHRFYNACILYQSVRGLSRLFGKIILSIWKRQTGVGKPSSYYL